ncbi:MAG: DMT family transporter, partial [Bacteroidota bacterium]
KDLLRLAICGLCGISVNQLFFFKGLSFTTPVNAAIIHSSSPILVMLFASLFIKERISWTKAMGVLLGAMGAYLLITTGRQMDFSSDTSLGNLFIFINIISYSFYLVFAKPLMNKYKPITVMSWVFLFGFLFIIPFSASSVTEIKWQFVPTELWFSLAYVIFVSTFITYLLTIFALKHLSATVTGYYIYIQPVIASLIALFTAKESLELYKIIAAILIFTGIFMVNKDFKLKRL